MARAAGVGATAIVLLRLVGVGEPDALATVIAVVLIGYALVQLARLWVR